MNRSTVIEAILDIWKSELGDDAGEDADYREALEKMSDLDVFRHYDIAAHTGRAPRRR